MQNPFDLLISKLDSLEIHILELKNKSKEDLSQKLYTKKEAALLLKVSEQSVYNYIKKGKIKSKQIGRPHLIPHTEIYNELNEVKSLKYKR